MGIEAVVGHVSAHLRRVWGSPVVDTVAVGKIARRLLGPPHQHERGLKEGADGDSRDRIRKMIGAHVLLGHWFHMCVITRGACQISEYQ